jgi:microcystin-dependent protein
MADEPFLGEVRMFGFNFAPKGWVMCNGQILPINQFAALFSILGTTYGGNGTTNFALPNLQGNVPVHTGGGIALGQIGGAAAVTLTINQINHTHSVNASATATSATAAGNYPAPSTGGAAYGNSLNATMNPAIIGSMGGSQAHNNMQPYLVVNFCIAITGIFPTRN